MDFKSFIDLMKNIEKYLLLAVICFVTSLVINILLAYNLSEYLNKLSKFSIYFIIISIVSGMVIAYTIIHQVNSWIKNIIQNKRINMEFDNFHLNLKESEVEIIDLLRNGPDNINPLILKSGSVHDVRVLEEKKILKIIKTGSITKEVNGRGGLYYPQKYTQLLCDLTDDYKNYLKYKKN